MNKKSIVLFSMFVLVVLVMWLALVGYVDPKIVLIAVRWLLVFLVGYSLKLIFDWTLKP